jgi:uncharacterized protein YutE (UPF0331/DUF86 family)
MDDVVLDKAGSIERCVGQIRNYHAEECDLPFEVDYIRQDAIAMNIQRACQQAIDLANYITRIRKLEISTDSE